MVCLKKLRSKEEYINKIIVAGFTDGEEVQEDKYKEVLMTEEELEILGLI